MQKSQLGLIAYLGQYVGPLGNNRPESGVKLRMDPLLMDHLAMLIQLGCGVGSP